MGHCVGQSSVRESIDAPSKARADRAIDWLRGIVASALGDPDAYGEVSVKIKLQGGKIPGSVILTNEIHFR